MRQDEQIVFTGLDRSPALVQNIREHIAKLHRFSDHITSCRVSIGRDNHRQRHGPRYFVHITTHVPTRELVVNQDKHNNPAHEDPYIAVRDAFQAMTRQLEDHERKIRGDVKHHNPKPPRHNDASDD